MTQNTNPSTGSPKKKRTWKFWTCLGCSSIVGLTVIIIGALFVIGVIFGKPEPDEPDKADKPDKSTEEPQIVGGKKGREMLGTRKFSLDQTIVLTNEGSYNASPVKMNLALIHDLDPYQDVISREIIPSDYEIVTDEEGNEFAQIEIKKLAPGDSTEISASYEIDVNIFKDSLGACQGEMITSYLSPDTYIESQDPEIKNVASQVIQGASNDCEEALLLYNYIGDTLAYAGYVAEDGGALRAFKNKGGDCTDFSDLYLALTRASGIPSRFLEGFTYAKEAERPEDVKHDWTEVYLPPIGWTPVDALWGQESYNRPYYFAQTDGIHIVLTRGRNVENLGNKHYYWFQWWQPGGKTNIAHEMSIDIIPLDEESAQ